MRDMSNEHSAPFNVIPTMRPRTPLLDGIESPADLRLLDEQQLPQLARELRERGGVGGQSAAGAVTRCSERGLTSCTVLRLLG